MNVNDTVRVTLTEAGKRRAAEWGREYGITAGLEMSDGERAGEWQLWRLMQVFGAAMYNGMPKPLFEKNEILFGGKAMTYDGKAMGGLNDWRDRVHNLAIEKGWHQDRDINNPHVLGSMLALIHSEVSEALEEVRTGTPGAVWFRDTFNGELLGPREREEGQPESRYKPVGFPSELADIIIRTLDLCGALGIDIEQAVEAKHAYNCTRSHRHGGKAL